MQISWETFSAMVFDCLTCTWIDFYFSKVIVNLISLMFGFVILTSEGQALSNLCLLYYLISEITFYYHYLVIPFSYFVEIISSIWSHLYNLLIDFIINLRNVILSLCEVFLCFTFNLLSKCYVCSFQFRFLQQRYGSFLLCFIPFYYILLYSILI